MGRICGRSCSPLLATSVSRELDGYSFERLRQMAQRYAYRLGEAAALLEGGEPELPAPWFPRHLRREASRLAEAFDQLQLTLEIR